MRAYFLGAGACIPLGGPTTNQILTRAFTSPPLPGEQVAEDLLLMSREYISDYFGIPLAETADARTADGELPQLGDVLSALDQFIIHGGSFGTKYPPERMERVRRAVGYAIYRGLRVSLTLESVKERRRQLYDVQFAARLRSDIEEEGRTSSSGVKVAVITTNYDTLTNYALAEWMERGEVELGTAFANYPPRPKAGRLGEPKVALYKLHGSLDWLYCTACRRLFLGTEFKSRTFAYDAHFSYVAGSDVVRSQDLIPRCESDGSPLEPVLITPTLLKDYANAHIATVYQAAWNTLMRADRVTFIGYSLPPEDYHLLYLLKRTLVRPHDDGSFDRASIEVVGPPDECEKDPHVAQRYRQIFGPDIVYHPVGFEKYLES